MSQIIRRFVQCAFVASVLFFPGVQQYAYSASSFKPVDGHPPMQNSCALHLTRPPDSSITLDANKMLYEQTVDVPQTPYQLPYPGVCTPRWVTEINIPSTASGCATCNKYAEIAAGAANFVKSKKFEVYFYRPADSAGEAFCKSYIHDVTVYEKANGESTFQLKRSLHYRGHWESGTCHVKATYLGNPNWDTAETYASATIPASGTDVYRLVQYLTVDGVYRDINVVVQFEKMP